MAEFFNILIAHFIGPGNFNDQLLIFALLFCRIIIITSIVPFLGANTSINSARIAIAASLSFLYWPQVYAQTQSIPLNNAFFMLLMLKEALVGFIIAFVTTQVFYISFIAGQLIDLFRGATMSQVAVPHLKQQSSALSSLLFQLYLVLFMTAGFHGFFFDGLAQSFEIIPVDRLPNFSGGMELFVVKIVQLFAEVFSLGLKLAMPAAIIVLLINIGFGLLNRIAPQINAFFMSMPAIALGALLIFLAAITSTLEQFTLFTHLAFQKYYEILQLF